MKKNVFKNFDFILLGIVLILIAFGLLNIYSASFTFNTPGLPFYLKQLCWALAGLGLIAAIYNLNNEIFLNYSYYYYLFNIILLVLLLVLRVSTKGSSRWLSLGPFMMQPSEFMKFAVILALSRYLMDKEKKLKGFADLVIPIGIVLVPFFLVLKQPDLGTALAFIPIFFISVYLCDLPYRYLFYLITPFLSLLLFKFPALWFSFMVLLALIIYFNKTSRIDAWIVIISSILSGIGQPLLWNFLKDYQKKRIMIFLNPELDPLGSGYSVIQSKIAVGSGQFFGKGWLHGSQNRLNFIPEHHTDFIFSVIGEEWGFVGGFLLLILFFILIIRILDIALQAKNKFSTLVASGISVIFVFHIVVNIGMSMGVAPVVGVPLPFLSYGGSYLLNFLIMIGVLEKIKDEG
ncbi:MAG: rod shape-determining protein RodA [bacterium]|nr:rod shape-determining protein RodA [bacterium]